MKWLILLVLVCLGWMFWSGMEKTTPENVPRTPEEMVNAIAQQKNIEAERLARLCLEHPDLVNRSLRNQVLTVSGNVEDFSIRGIDFVDLEIHLGGVPGKKIIFQSDVASARQGGFYFAFKLERVGNRVLLYPRSQNGSITGGPRVLLERHQPIHLQGVLKRVDSNAVRFKLLMNQSG